MALVYSGHTVYTVSPTLYFFLSFSIKKPLAESYRVTDQNAVADVSQYLRARN
jgi:hypothetical protein